MRPQRIIDVLAVISMVVITLAIICLMSGCRANKEAQAHYTEAATETTVGHETNKTDMTAFWETFSRYATSTDSVTMEISADSIITPSGLVIYAPDIRRTDYGQKAGAETDATMSASTATETAIESTETSNKTTEKVSAQQTETTTVAEPPNITAITIAAIIAVALILMLIILWLAYRKK